MVVGKTIRDLKERPKDEKAAIAGGIAIAVIVVLFVVWGVFFFHQLRSGAAVPPQDSGQGSGGNGLQEAQQQLQTEYASMTSELENLPDENEAAQEQLDAQQPQAQPQPAAAATTTGVDQ